MGINTIFLCTTLGALVGTLVGILLMNRKVRLPITGADLAALRAKVATAESSLAAANASVEDLRKQLADRDQTIQQNAEELRMRQEVIDRSAQQAEKEKLQRSVDEQLSLDLNSRNTVLLRERNDFESRLEYETKQSAEKSAQITVLEVELETAKRQVLELTGRVDGLIAESAALSRFREQESRHRAALEAQMTQEQDRAQQLLKQVADLESERSRLEIELREERESATRGMELLAMAQANLSRVAKPVNGEIKSGELRHLPVEQAAVPSEPVEVVPTAASAD